MASNIHSFSSFLYTQPTTKVILYSQPYPKIYVFDMFPNTSNHA